LKEEKKGILKVKTFTEKPGLNLAKKFLASGDFVWNAGIFVWSAQTIVDCFETYLPDIAEAFAEGEGIYGTAQEPKFIEKVYSQCKNISIDYGILEKSSSVYVIPADFDWSDLGSWVSLHEIRQKDKKGNVIDGQALIGEA